MKKSVLILIAIIYIGSIVFVGFFGMKMVSYNPTVIPESVVCINEDMTSKQDEEGEYKTIRLTYQEGLKYQLQWRVYPDNASQNVQFVYSSNIATISPEGEISFTGYGTLTLKIACEEFNTTVQRVRIIVLRPR